MPKLYVYDITFYIGDDETVEVTDVNSDGLIVELQRLVDKYYRGLFKVNKYTLSNLMYHNKGMLKPICKIRKRPQTVSEKRDSVSIQFRKLKPLVQKVKALSE